MKAKKYMTKRNFAYVGLALVLAFGVLIFLNGGDFPGLDITLNPNDRIYTLAWPHIGVAVVAPDATPGIKGSYLNDEAYFLISESDDRYYTIQSTENVPMLRFEFNISSLASTYKYEEGIHPIKYIKMAHVQVEGYGQCAEESSMVLRLWDDTNQEWYEPEGNYDYTRHTKAEDRYLYVELSQEEMISHMTKEGVIKCVVSGPMAYEGFESKLNLDQVYLKMTYESEDEPTPSVCNYNGLCEAEYGENILNCGDCAEESDPPIEPDPEGPCAGVVCGDVCEDYNLIARVCSEGQCIKASTKETNSLVCGYVAPPPNPPSGGIGLPIYMFAIVATVVAIGAMYVLRSEKNGKNKKTRTAKRKRS